MKSCAIRILNFVFFNVLGQVGDLKKDTESIKKGVNYVQGDLKEGVDSIKEEVKDIEKNIKQVEESLKEDVKDIKKDTESIKEGLKDVKRIKERMEMIVQGSEYNASKGKENIMRRKLSNPLAPATVEFYIVGFSFTLNVLLNPDFQNKFRESI